MAKAINTDNFFQELVAAGIDTLALRCTWGDDGTFEWNDTPDEIRQLVLAVYEAHDPLKAVAPAARTPLQLLLDYVASQSDAPDEIKALASKP